MNSIGNKNVYTPELDFLNNNNSENTIVKEIMSEIKPSTIKALKQGALTSKQVDDMHGRLEKIALQIEELFGEQVDLSNVKTQEFIKKEVLLLITSVEETVKNQAPDLIREAGLSEAVFSHKGDYRPILATDSLATCIGVAGYDPVNTFGFVVHFTNEDEVEASGTMLLNRIQYYREQKTSMPLIVHLRGGIKGLSESLLSAVKNWLVSTDLSVIIASEDTLQASISEGIGIPKVPGSIKLDCVLAHVRNMIQQ